VALGADFHLFFSFTSTFLVTPIRWIFPSFSRWSVLNSLCFWNNLQNSSLSKITSISQVLLLFLCWGNLENLKLIAVSRKCCLFLKEESIWWMDGVFHGCFGNFKVPYFLSNFVEKLRYCAYQWQCQEFISWGGTKIIKYNDKIIFFVLFIYYVSFIYIKKYYKYNSTKN
jgi:hypothetical protein